jgi:hypothetical protein
VRLGLGFGIRVVADALDEAAGFAEGLGKEESGRR